MKKLFFSLAIMMVAVMTLFIGCSSGHKEKLKVLYVGGSPNIETVGGLEIDKDTLAKSAAERTADFAEFLNDHFTDVTVVDAQEYTPDMSKEYDVTLFDGTPKPIREKIYETDETGRVTNYEPAAYLPDDFSYPAVFIANASEILGRTVGSKNDWYCLCLDNYAFDMNRQHPIFQGPFNVDITTETRPTPAGIVETAPMLGEVAPAEMEMWKISDVNYEGNSGVRIGMVSRPGGYLDSPEAEVISGGKTSKTRGAVAIGRHGNFFHWGFAADPKHLTPSGRAALANAIVYMAKGDHKPIIARKLDDRLTTRDQIKMLKWGMTKEAWQTIMEENMKFYNRMDSICKAIAAKKEKGEELTADEKAYEKYPAPQKPQAISFGDYLKQRNPVLFAQFGEDETKYADYYDSNAPYFHPDQSGYNLVIDEDVKAMGVGNNDVKLLGMAVADLEKGGETAERGRRVLERYTLCRFETPAQWREWLDKYQDKLFFTESGGYLWLVNSYDPDVVGNDYSVLKKKKDEPDVKLPTVTELAITTPDSPVAVAGVFDKSKSEVVLKVSIYQGFHIYATVDPSDPFITTEVSLKLPEGVNRDGDLIQPQRTGTSNATTYYVGDVEFRQKVSGRLKGYATWTIRYQCCDNSICLTPQTLTVNVAL